MIISRGKINVLFDNKRFVIINKSSSSIKTVLIWIFVSFALPVALIAYVISLDANDSIVDNFPLGDDASQQWLWGRH